MLFREVAVLPSHKVPLHKGIFSLLFRTKSSRMYLTAKGLIFPETFSVKLDLWNLFFLPETVSNQYLIT